MHNACSLAAFILRLLLGIARSIIALALYERELQISVNSGSVQISLASFVVMPCYYFCMPSIDIRKGVDSTAWQCLAISYGRLHASTYPGKEDTRLSSEEGVTP